MSTHPVPKISINKEKNVLEFNTEAIETMELDQEGSRVIFIEVSDPEKKRNAKEVLVMKTNGSLCDDVENIKDVFPPDHIRTVNIVKDAEGDIESGYVSTSEAMVESINSIIGDAGEYKILLCNSESVLGKEFREQFDIRNNYYKIVNTSDKRKVYGKEKEVSINNEERIKL